MKENKEVIPMKNIGVQKNEFIYTKNIKQYYTNSIIHVDSVYMVVYNGKEKKQLFSMDWIKTDFFFKGK